MSKLDVCIFFFMNVPTSHMITCYDFKPPKYDYMCVCYYLESDNALKKSMKKITFYKAKSFMFHNEQLIELSLVKLNSWV
jgi:hypothetical protein